MQEDQKFKVILDYITSLRSGWATKKEVSINKSINSKRVTTSMVLKSHEALKIRASKTAQWEKAPPPSLMIWIKSLRLRQ